MKNLSELIMQDMESFINIEIYKIKGLYNNLGYSESQINNTLKS